MNHEPHSTHQDVGKRVVENAVFLWEVAILEFVHVVVDAMTAGFCFLVLLVTAGTERVGSSVPACVFNAVRIVFTQVLGHVWVVYVHTNLGEPIRVAK